MEKKTVLAAVMLHMVMKMKMFHWATPSYAQHKASDQYVEGLSALVDKYVETMMGHYGPIGIVKMKLPSAMHAEDTLVLMEAFTKYLMREVDDTKPDLVTIRDEIIALTRQTMYLLRLK